MNEGNERETISSTLTSFLVRWPAVVVFARSAAHTAHVVHLLFPYELETSHREQPLVMPSSLPSAHDDDTPASATATASAPATMLNRRETTETSRGRQLVDQQDYAEEGKGLNKEEMERERMLGSNGDVEGEGAPLTARDKRALVLLVVLCKSYPHLPSTRTLTALQIYSRASPSDWPLVPSPSSSVPSCRTRKSASSPSAPTRTRSNSSGPLLSIPSSPNESGEGRVGSYRSRSSWERSFGGWEGMWAR